MKRIIVSFLVVGALALVSLAEPRQANAGTVLEPSEVVSLDATACWNTCQKCQDKCNDKPAGSARDNCKDTCTTSASSCCSVAGRKPPNHLACTCGM